MNGRTISDLETIAFHGTSEQAGRAIEELRLRVERGERTAARLAKMGFEDDARTARATIAAVNATLARIDSY